MYGIVCISVAIVFSYIAYTISVLALPPIIIVIRHDVLWLMILGVLFLALAVQL